MESSANTSPELVEIGAERSGRICIRIREQKLDVGRGLSFGGGDTRAPRVCSLGADRRREIVVEDPGPAQIALETPETLAAPLLFHPLQVDVRARVVGSRVRGRAIRQRLDERRALAGPR